MDTIPLEIKESKLITALRELYSSVPNSPNWAGANSLILNMARKHRLALGGSIGMAITRKVAIKTPGDIDLFTDSNVDAMNFLTDLMKYLHKKAGSYYRIYVNNQTKFTLDGVLSHYRIQGPPYWLPVCVMVMKSSIRQFYWNKTPVQFFDDIVAAAKLAEKIDGKNRVAPDMSLKDMIRDGTLLDPHQRADKMNDVDDKMDRKIIRGEFHSPPSPNSETSMTQPDSETSMTQEITNMFDVFPMFRQSPIFRQGSDDRLIS